MTAHEILHSVTSGAMQPHQIPVFKVSELKEIIDIELNWIEELCKERYLKLTTKRQVELENKKETYQYLLAIL